MAQTGGIFDALRDNVKKTVAAPMVPKRPEAVPGLMATRNELKSHRTRTIPKGHVPTKRGSR
jgi:hypothetical protein